MYFILRSDLNSCDNLFFKVIKLTFIPCKGISQVVYGISRNFLNRVTLALQGFVKLRIN